MNKTKKGKSALLFDPSRGTDHGWKFVQAKCDCDFIAHLNYNRVTDETRRDLCALRIHSYTAAEQRGIVRKIKNLPKGSYVFKACFKVKDRCFGTARSGVYLRIVSGYETEETQHVSEVRDEDLWLEIPFSLPRKKDVQFQICLDGVGTVYVKEASLQFQHPLGHLNYILRKTKD